ncbi:MAG: LOG family protein [Acidobacteria bacterium]|nr:LOG family protein [Acidobacteriota bacterium]
MAAFRNSVAVFGSSEPPPGSPAYREAEEVGRRLAESGCTVVNGGYGGVMEASARGAREAGGTTLGVTTSVLRFRDGANRYIDRERREPDLFTRTRGLIEEANAFIILPGKSGTLAEWAFLLALCRADLLGPKPIVLLGHLWEDLLGQLRRLGIIGEPELAVCRTAGSPEEAVRTVARCLKDAPHL